MDRVAVQVSSTHHRMPERADGWQILVLAVGIALICYGARPIVRTHRWMLTWPLILGLAVVGIFAALVST